MFYRDNLETLFLNVNDDGNGCMNLTSVTAVKSTRANHWATDIPIALNSQTLDYLFFLFHSVDVPDGLSALEFYHRLHELF